MREKMDVRPLVAIGMELWFRHAPQFALGAYQETVADNCGTGHAHVWAEVIDVEEFKFRTGLDDKGFSVLAQTKHLAVVGPGRRGKTCRRRKASSVIFH